MSNLRFLKVSGFTTLLSLLFVNRLRILETMSLSELALLTPAAAESLLTSIRNKSKQTNEIHALLAQNALEDLFVYVTTRPSPGLTNLGL